MKVKFPDKDTRGKNITNTDYIELRDYFACHAMQGMLANGISLDIDKEMIAITRAKTAYAIADAMMEARK